MPRVNKKIHPDRESKLMSLFRNIDYRRENYNDSYHLDGLGTSFFGLVFHAYLFLLCLKSVPIYAADAYLIGGLISMVPLTVALGIYLLADNDLLDDLGEFIKYHWLSFNILANLTGYLSVIVTLVLYNSPALAAIL